MYIYKNKRYTRSSDVPDETIWNFTCVIYQFYMKKNPDEPFAKSFWREGFSQHFIL